MTEQIPTAPSTAPPTDVAAERPCAEDAAQWQEAADAAAALAHPLRLWILRRLLEQPCCVGDVVCDCAADQPTVSRHLAVLRRAGLVVSETRGRQRLYRLLDRDATERLLADLTRVAAGGDFT